MAYIYAQLDSNNIVEAISQLSKEITQGNMILLPEYDQSLLGKKWNGESWVDTPKSPNFTLTKLEFLRRFAAEERIAIRASTDPVIVDFLHLLDLAQEVRLDDADTQAGVRHLESVGLLAAGRAEAILAPEQA